MNEPRDRWTIRFLRGDGRQAHTLSAGRSTMLAGATAAVAILLLAGAGLGWAWTARAESARVTALVANVQALTAERGDIATLSSRLEQVEQEYARLRDAVTAGAPTASPSVALPNRLAAVSPPGGPITMPAWPVSQRGFITRTFGSRRDEANEGHPGIDIAVPTGSYVRAMRGGVVEDAGEDDVYGRLVRIAHGDGLSSLYGHNSWLFVTAGDSVQRLQVIALSGNTGRSTAPHLHFEVARDGELLDPLDFVNSGGQEVTGGAGQTGVEPR